MSYASGIPVYTNSSTAGRTSIPGKIFLTVIYCVVLEGALRKWLTPALTIPLVLLRDSLAVLAVIVALRRGTLNFRSKGPQVLALWTALVLLWSTLQAVVIGSPAALMLIGWRFWLLYLWFAVAIAASLTERDLVLAKRHLLFLLLAHVPLVLVQHFLPPGAFLNRQIDGDEESVFRVAGDIVRTTGTFSFTAGFTCFLAVVTPLVFALFDGSAGKQGLVRRRTVFLGGLAAATLVSGSRSSLVFFAAVAGVYMLFALVSKRRSNLRATVLMVVFALVTGAAFSVLFDRAIEASRERFEVAGENENVSQRVQAIFFGEPGVYDRFTYMGYGLGVGSNFAGAVSGGERTFLLAETEAGRTLLEGGLLGLALAGMKILVLTAGLFNAFRCLRKTGHMTPMLLWITTASAFLTWAIVGQLTINALAYVLLALAMASLRHDARPHV